VVTNRRRKYYLSEREQKIIRDLYNGTTVKLNVIMMRLNRKYPRWYVRRAAQEMGLSRCKEPAWNQKEVAYLLDHYHIRGYVAMRNALKSLNGGFTRTRTAIHLKTKRLRICKSSEGYTMLGMCALFGVDHHKIKEWMSKGYLRGKQRGTNRKKCQGGDMWYFEDAWLRSFIIRHPEEIDLRRVEKNAFIGLLASNIQDIMTACRCPLCGSEYQRLMNWTGPGTPWIKCDECRYEEEIIPEHQIGSLRS